MPGSTVRQCHCQSKMNCRHRSCFKAKPTAASRNQSKVLHNLAIMMEKLKALGYVPLLLLGKCSKAHKWTTEVQCPFEFPPEGHMVMDKMLILWPHLPQYVIVWDNVNFHRGPLIRAWFTTHPRMVKVFLPPYSPFLNPIEEYFSAWRWSVYEHRAQDQRSLLHAMDAVCEDLTGDQCRGWLRHARRFFPRCIARENIRCDVDENLWPDRQQCVDGQEGEEDGGQEREGEDSDH
ncbi:unnamed protein product [Leuciscus chuanchicus]